VREYQMCHVQAVLQGDMALNDWLTDVPASLTAVAFGPHKGLIQLVLQVLASAPHDADTDTLSPMAVEAASCLLVLLQHPVPAVPEHTWAALRKLLDLPAAADGRVGSAGLLRLLSHAPVMRHLLVHCAVQGAPELREAVADVLRRMLASRDACIQAGMCMHALRLCCVAPQRLAARTQHRAHCAVCAPSYPDRAHAAGVVPWQPWLECLQPDSYLGPACALSDALLQRSQNKSEDTPWAVTRVLLQRLFRKEARVRHAAAKQLVVQVAGGAGVLDDTTIEGVWLRM
jgi:hypothetical protein